ncbi:hypothetical protein E2566_08065 [Pectobacterium punjabense]|uniref:Uncharacterized protein n=1 Tax=Pectobacterium punjabense TaxID=2108399 RepID=A0ABX6L0L5_9GAMM|nr:hypothetical protein [Pectobacterium punjabense]MBS4433278.1 hypothetical protein [Pectobacterium punjabense]PTA64109.1 hypothetical protein C9I36_11380 [Pectobacterium punjabense]QJA19875.1 hypothetical protein E2566_08065 [Pectobacterium punjabense]
MSNSNIGNWVAIVSVVASAFTAIYSTWDKSKTELALEEIKSKYEIQKSDKVRVWSEKKERCNLIVDAARKLAQAHGKVYRELKLEHQANMEENLWAAATVLTIKNQERFLSEYQKGPAKEDEGGFTYRGKLVSITLQGLADDGQKCFQELSQ